MTLFQNEIVDDFRQRLDDFSVVPAELVNELASLARGESVPTAEVFLAAIKAKIGDQPL